MALPAAGPDRFWGPRGVVVRDDGRVYLTDTRNKRIVVFNNEGQFLQEFGTEGDGQLDEPVGIALGPDGRVYVADTWNARVAVFSTEGQFQTSWPVQGWMGNFSRYKPYIAVDSQNRVYMTDPEGYRVIIFSCSEVPLAALGQYGPEENAFGIPVGIAVGKDQAIWIADAGNNRLSEFDLGE